MQIRPLILAARILDADYPKDPNPENWRTINGSKVHLNEKGQIDGGAGGKFKGKGWHSNFSAEKGFSGKYKAPKKLASKQSYGQQSPLQEAAAKAKGINTVSEYRPNGNKYPFSRGSYTPDRKNNAVWCKSTHESHLCFDVQAQKVYDSATDSEQKAIVEYTEYFSQFNAPLRGFEYGYGTNQYKGVGKIDFNKIGTNKNYYHPGELKKKIQNMTKFIDRSAFDEDIILRRGCDSTGMEKFFGLSKPMEKYSVEELQKKLLGKKVTEHGFMSCGAAENTGFTRDIDFKIYAPAGTKMAYVANYSAYPSENEMILQRGTQFRVTKIEKKDKRFYIDIEVVGYNMQKV